MKKILIGIVSAIVLVVFLWQAYLHGQARYTYEVTPVDRFVPIPIIYDSYSAFAKWRDREDNQLRVTWNQLLPPPIEKREEPYFLLLGTIDPGPQLYYVLEINGEIILEKAEHIEPLIHAMCALSRGGPETNHPKAVLDSIKELPQDKDQLIALALKFKPVKAVSPI